MKEKILSILGFVFVGYMWIAMLIFAPLYNYQYANKHGFWEWIFLGEIVPTAKALIWPVYLFNSSGKTDLSESEKNNFRHVKNCLLTNEEANDILSKGNIRYISVEARDKVLNLKKSALQEAVIVNDDILEKIHPDMKNHFRNELQQSIEIDIKILESSVPNEQDANRTNELHTKWADWYNDNREDFQTP